MEVWKERLKTAYRFASYCSPDFSTQNAAILVSDGTVIVQASNTLPHDIAATPDRLKRPLKYQRIVHAERNVLYTTARLGIRTQGLTMVCPWAACPECAQGIIQCGIKRLVVHEDMIIQSPRRWLEPIKIADQMLAEAGVEKLIIPGKLNADPIRFNGKLWHS